MNQSQLAKTTWDAVTEYSHMRLSNGVEVAVPYHINRMSNYLKTLVTSAGFSPEDADKILEAYKQNVVLYGNYRGKGTAAEIKVAVERLLVATNEPLQSFTPAGVRQVMQLNGLGIDCSGLVFNILSRVAASQNAMTKLIDSFAWSDPKKTGADHASANVIAAACYPIGWGEIAHGDLVFIRNMQNDGFNHVAMIVAHPDTETLILVQSAFSTDPSGVNLSDIQIKNDNPEWSMKHLMGRTWDQYLDEGRLYPKRLPFWQEI